MTQYGDIREINFGILITTAFVFVIRLKNKRLIHAHWASLTLAIPVQLWIYLDQYALIP